MDKEKLMTEQEWLAKYSAGQKKAKKKNVKKWVRNGVALGLVAVLSIAGTLAYLQKKTKDKTNTFIGSTGLKLSLTESNWDTDNDNQADDGEPMKEAEAYIPGTAYKKNPQLINWDLIGTNWVLDGNGNIDTTGATNESVGTYAYSEYVAFEVDLINKTSSSAPLKYTELTNAIEDIVFDSSNWVLIAYCDTSWHSLLDTPNNYFKTTSVAGNLDTGTTTALNDATKFVFAYATFASSKYNYTALAPNTATTPLFSQIKIKQDVYDFSNDTGVQVTDPTKYPKFDIKLIGASVDTKTYGDGATDNQKVQIGKDLLEVLGITI